MEDSHKRVGNEIKKREAYCNNRISAATKYGLQKYWNKVLGVQPEVNNKMYERAIHTVIMCGCTSINKKIIIFI